MTTPMDLARNRVQELENAHLFYCNELPWRCSNPNCRDCSTAAADICNASGANISKCSNSFSLAEWCFNAPRPDWLTEACGPLPGTFVTYEYIQKNPGLGFRGSNWGKSADSEGDGHVEWIMGQGKLTWGCHSHATDCGYDNNGLDSHELHWFAIPPHFIPWMTPKPPIDWDFIHDLVNWKNRLAGRRREGKGKVRLSGYLKWKDRGPDVLIMNKLLHIKGYLKAEAMDVYGLKSRRAVLAAKKANGWAKKDQDGKTFGEPLANILLR